MISYPVSLIVINKSLCKSLSFTDMQLSKKMPLEAFPAIYILFLPVLTIPHHYPGQDVPAADTGSAHICLCTDLPEWVLHWNTVHINAHLALLHVCPPSIMNDRRLSAQKALLT